MKTVTFPLTTGGNTFSNVKDLYNYYYAMPLKEITEFSRYFWGNNINLTELVHFPERFNIVTQ